MQYEVVTHPVLVKHLHAPVLTALETALTSHRYALSIDPDDADTLFNTAGMLTSIAELVAQEAKLPYDQALSLLEEALELQNRCLTRQEYLYAESQQQQSDSTQKSEPVNQEIPANVDSEQPRSANGGTNQPEEQWASIIEPVTKDTLIDTIEAQISTLTTLCSVLSSSPGSAPGSSLAWVEEYSSKLLNIKLPAYLDAATERVPEIALTKANFLSALLEAGFRSGSLDAPTYKRERDAAFAVPELDMQNSFTALLANATSLIAFNSALVETMLVDVAPLASMRWNALSAAIGDLTKGSKLSETAAEDVPKTHLLRGDASMLQFQLSRPTSAYQPAISNTASLLKNAEVFYRNASRLARSDDERSEALLKEAVALFLQNREMGMAKIQALLEREGSQSITMRMEDLISDGLIDNDDVIGIA